MRAHLIPESEMSSSPRQQPFQRRELSFSAKIHEFVVRFISGTLNFFISLNPVKFSLEMNNHAKDLALNTNAAELGPGKICFIGSSFFTYWTHMERDFSPLPVFNHGFGGAQSQHVLANFEQLVLRFTPKLIVYYCGVNDVNFSDSTNQNAMTAVVNFESFVRKVKSTLPNTHIMFVSVIYSPIQFARNRVVQCVAINEKVREFIESDQSGKLHFFDLNNNPPLPNSLHLLDLANSRNLYRFDLIHYTEEGYGVVGSVLKRGVGELWGRIEGEGAE